MKLKSLFPIGFAVLSISGLATAQEPSSPGTAQATSNLSDSAHNSEDGAPPLLQLTIRIEHDWKSPQGIVVDHFTDHSLGTVVGPRTILTHNHFDPNLGRLHHESLTFTDRSGSLIFVSATGVMLEPINWGTMLVNLPGGSMAPAASLADQATIAGLVAGDTLTVAYWDDTDQQFAQQNFYILKIGDGVATLADPGRVVNQGDSGGGAYFEGKLMGNTWSVNVDQNCQPTGSFNVALLPPEVLSG